MEVRKFNSKVFSSTDFYFIFLAELVLHRDEALSSIISIDTFDLSLSVGQMRIEEEFGGTGMFSMFYRRISSQLSQLIVKIYLNHFFSLTLKFSF